jgi:hypothetical protein
MRKAIFAVPALLIGFQVAALADTIMPGTEIPTIDVARWDQGRIYPAHVSRDVRARDGDLAIPQGSYAELIVRQVGPDQFALDLESVTVNGNRYALDTAGPQYNLPRDTYDRGSGLVGSILGAIDDANGHVVTNGREIQVPAGAVIRFQLREPMRVVNWGDPGYSRGEYHYHREHDWYR